MERDPVCEAEIRPGQEGASINYHGQVFHFCSAECKKLFERNPRKYLRTPADTARR